MDAGDWDRRSQHLSVTYGLLELLRDVPRKHFRELRLTLPPDEAGNGIPDLLDEALWNVAFYQRLQTDDGGVRGGIEQTGHPSFGQTSWQESLLAAAFEPRTPRRRTTSRATAAKLAGAARTLHDAERAAALSRDCAAGVGTGHRTMADAVTRRGPCSGR